MDIQNVESIVIKVHHFETFSTLRFLISGRDLPETDITLYAESRDKLNLVIEQLKTHTVSEG
jgi:hypothetical protein